MEKGRCRKAGRELENSTTGISQTISTADRVHIINIFSVQYLRNQSVLPKCI